MSSFSRSALEMLQAAEGALTQRRGYQSSVADVGRSTKTYAYGDGPSAEYMAGHWHCDPNAAAMAPGAAGVEELQQQLSRAMRELLELRAELAQERDRRYDTLAALGRQWKEDVLVEVHRRDAALQSDVAAVEEKMTAQWKESSESRLVARRQLEELMRAGKVRDTDRFQLREELQETTRQLEERAEAALAQSTAARADCSRQLEQERAALSQRLDAELLRLVEMRRDDQRALQQAKDIMRQESVHVRADVRRAVQEVWDASAAALIKTATEPIEQLRAELRSTRATVQAMEEKVADCVRTCQAECRLHTTTTAERLHALEAKEAVAASGVDRAERKADAAYEAARRMEGSVEAAKEASDRAVVQVGAAVERAQRVEHALVDRDSRLVAVESQLHAIATAEGLRAEVETCKRQAGRLEGRVEAVGAVCGRVEQLVDRTVRQVDSFAERIDGCERTTQRGVETVQRVQETVDALEEAGEQTRARFDNTEVVMQRQGLAVTKLEQRVAASETRLEHGRQQQEQQAKEQLATQREMMERAEVTHAAATRAQQVSSEARTEVHRLERRLDEIDRGLAARASEATSLRGSLEGQRTQAVEMQRQHQTLADEVRALSGRLEERLAPVRELQCGSTERLTRAEAHVQHLTQKLAECEEHLQEMGGRVQDYLKDAIRHHVGDVQKRLFGAMNEGMTRVTERVVAVEGAAEQAQQRAAELPAQLAAAQQTTERLQRAVQSNEAALQAVGAQVQALAVQAEAHAADRQRLGTVQQELMRLTAVQRRMQEEVAQTQDAVRRVHAAVAAASGARDRSLSELVTSQARTASTEMAPAAEVSSSSPSAHRPPGPGQRDSAHSSAAVGPDARGSQPPAANRSPPTSSAVVGVAVPPLANTSAASLRELQDQQRASSGSRSSSTSKEGSGERPALHLSGVSSVRPTGEEERLHSVAEAEAHDSDSADAEDTVEAFDERPLVAARPQSASLSLAASAASPLAAGATETVEQLSAPAHASTQASGLVNVSQRTAIREFTTVASSSSSSAPAAAESSDDDGDAGAGAGARVGSGLVRRPEERTEDVSTDATTTVTLTTESSPAQSGRRQIRQRPETAKRAGVAMTSAWGRQSPDSSSEGAASAVARPLVRATPVPARVSPPTAEESDAEPEEVASATEDSDDRVLAVTAGSADGDDESVRETTAEEASIDERGNASTTRTSHALPTSDSAPSPQQRRWNDWDVDDDDDEDEDSGAGAEDNGSDDAVAFEPVPVQPRAGFFGSPSDEESDDAVTRASGAGESSAVAEPRRIGLTPPAAPLAATIVHHRQAAVEELSATPRRVFVSTGPDSTGVPTQGLRQPSQDSVPRHGRGTTSSSSSSAERAEALGLRGATTGATPQRQPTQLRRYTNFDDSTSSEDD